MIIESEELLETILNLEHARQRERMLRQEADILLVGMRRINESQNPEELFNNLISVLNEIFHFQDAFILQLHENGSMTPFISTSSQFDNTVWHPQALFKRVLSGQPAAVFDVTCIPEWQAHREISSKISSALHIFLHDGQNGAILICTHPDPHHFGPSHIKQASHFSSFASQSLLALINSIRLQKTRLEILKNQKLESLGLLAGGIAHDFNNILTVILGNISLARKQVKSPEKVEQRLLAAENALFRARSLTQQLLTFAKGGEPIKRIILLDGLLKEAADFATHGTALKCSFSFDNQVWPVEADEGQLSQVIHNLIINAIQAMPEGGTISIGAENIQDAVNGQDMVRIYVTDSGSGISEENLQRIFDPFFTTKQQGSGLGLATCHSIIKKHGGSISAASTLGEGSTFSILIPASCESEIIDQKRKNSIQSGQGRVLVMDDEIDVLETVQEMLKELGYQVECASNSQETVALYRKGLDEGVPFTTVILDLTIPGETGGKETINMLRAIDPEINAIVSSGYSNNPILANFREYGFKAMIHKPYELSELSNVIQQNNLKVKSGQPDR